MLVVLAVTVVMTGYLYVIVPKGFFPQPGHRPDAGRAAVRPVEFFHR